MFMKKNSEECLAIIQHFVWGFPVKTKYKDCTLWVPVTKSMVWNFDDKDYEIVHKNIP
jgi:hypothetical protein